MPREDLVFIGKTKKPHGIKGELKLYVEDKFEEDFYHVNIIFLNVGGSETPFFVEGIRGEAFPILKLEDVDTRSRALDFSHKEIYLRKADLLKDEEKAPIPEILFFKHLVGFEIEDENIGAIGIIDEVIEMPQQEMAVLQIKNKEVLIPLSEGLIVEILEKEKIVKMDLPEGLVEL